MMPKRYGRGAVFMVACVAGLTWACTRPAEPIASETPNEPAPLSDVERAVAVLHPTEGHEATGTVSFERAEDGVNVRVRIEGLRPGEHGLHVHEFGDCSKADGTSAGGHFNPFDAPHGAPDAESRHVGDLGNVTANEDGVAEADFVDTVIAFEGEASIVGRGVIVHADADDLTSQPTGAAGARVSCGVVGIAAPE
jgi:Cu-Zn family superoxide dismutase